MRAKSEVPGVQASFGQHQSQSVLSKGYKHTIAVLFLRMVQGYASRCEVGATQKMLRSICIE